MSRHAPWLDVDLDALRRNARRYGERLGVPLLPMVKADGYGLGAAAVARALEPLDPWGFGVASIDEVAELRDAGVTRPVLVILPLLPSLREDYLAAGATPALGDLDAVAAWLPTGRPFHLAIDTGMGRTGFRWHDEATLGRLAVLLGGIQGYEGIFTHFASADVSEEDTRVQWERFTQVLERLGRPRFVHAAASAAARYGRRYGASLARPGIFLYGGAPAEEGSEPVAALRATVLAVRPIRAGDAVSYGGTWHAPADGDVVTLGIGYADGVPRSLGNRGLVAIGDGIWPIAGRVTMDMVMTVVPTGRVPVGATATIWGGPIPLVEQAARAGTISYELLTAVGRRVIRRYGGGT